MKIHEYQGKELLRQAGVPVPRGEAAFSVDEALEVAGRLAAAFVLRAGAGRGVRAG